MTNINSFEIIHKFLGYLLLPTRLLILIPYACLVIIVITLSNFKIFPKELGFFLLKGFAIMVATIGGINIHIKKDKQYENYKLLSEKEKYLVVYNHISALDIPVLFSILKTNITFLASENQTKTFPISFFFKFMEGIEVNIDKKTNATQRIKDHLDSNSNNKLSIAPDSGREIPDNEVIRPFRTGAFVHKNKVLPVAIRYQVSHKEDCLNWCSEKNKKKNILRHLYDMLLDGNIDVFVKFLDIQEYNEEKHKTPKGYADDVHKKMSHELRKLPKQINNLTDVKPTDSNCIFFVTILLFLLSCLAYILSDYAIAFHACLLSFTGFLFHSFPTNNTLLADKIAIMMGTFTFFFRYTNTQSANIFKYIIFFHAFLNSVKNNVYNELPTARGTTNWLRDHLYCVQLPLVIAVGWGIIDHNFFLPR